MHRAVLIAGLFLYGLCVGTARAQNLSLVRDDEIERAVSFYLTPLFEKAGLDAENLSVHLVKDDSINAFAAKGLHVFVHTGLLTRADDAQEIIAVLAHETGHIAGGHIVRMYENMKIARRSMLLSMILGAATVAVGGGADTAIGAASGGFSSMRSVFAAYRRSEENAADQTAAALLQKTGHDFSGFETIMRKLQTQESLGQTDDFALWRSHPAAKERLEAILNQTRLTRPSPDLTRIAQENALFRRVKAKLSAFLSSPEKTRARYPETDESLPARYARAIADYRAGLFKRALEQTDALIADYPDDPYFYELKGQILFETGRAADAVAPYEKAVSLQSDAILLRTGLVQALIERDDADALRRARKELTVLEPIAAELPSIWRLKAIVHGRLGQKGLADCALAEYGLATGDLKLARTFAERARGELNETDPARLRAEDILFRLRETETKKKTVGTR